MDKKYLSIFLWMILSSLMPEWSFAQHCVSFDYDLNGNRIERYFYESCSKDEIVLSVDDEVEELVENEVFLYPNPTNAVFHLIFPQYSDDRLFNYSIFDGSGVLWQQGQITSSEMAVDIGNCTSGVYVMVISCGDETFVKSVVKL